MGYSSDQGHALTSSRKYRTDIDGLRAVAVLAVVFNHLRFPHSFGGYVGVDVFFVISGYLIGASLITEFSTNSFSLVEFYERRARRILPALFAMLAVSSFWAYRFLTPASLVSYAHSLVAAVFSYSNFYFWGRGGYFDAPSSAQPLLHTWSLAVEEQFYLVFPLMLFLVFRWFPQRLRGALWATAVVAFLGAVWAVKFDSTIAFFWSPLRAWELLAGAIVSQETLTFLRSRWTRELAAAAGFCLIIFACLRFSAFTPFPGAAALVPCLSSVLIIAAGQVGDTATGKLLSARPFTFIGLISYSLYLWHWPILVFQNSGLLLTNRPSFERNTKLLILALSLVCATLSWRFVETPFRKGSYRPERKTLFWLSGAGAALFLCLFSWLSLSRGVPSRLSEESLRVAQFENYDISTAWREGSCFIVPPSTLRDYKPETCLNSVQDRKQYLLYGDSTAAQLYPGLVKVFPEIHFQQASSAGCLPYVDDSEDAAHHGAFSTNCREMWGYIHKIYLAQHHPDAIILAAGWKEAGLDNLGHEIRTLQKLGVPMILVGPEIAFDMPLPTLLISEMGQKSSERVRNESLTRHLKLNESLDRTMSEMARKDWHVRYISYYKDLCGAQTEMEAKSRWETTTGCPLFTDTGEPLVFDEHHLTLSASLLFAKIIREQGQLP